MSRRARARETGRFLAILIILAAATVALQFAGLSDDVAEAFGLGGLAGVVLAFVWGRS